jgi:hypothetical protein
MTIRSDGRRMIQVTLRPELYDQIKQICDDHDMPLSVWGRAVFERAIREDWLPASLRP